MVQLAMHTAGPVIGLIILKALGVILGVGCWYWRRHLLKPLNIMFSAVVVWNLIALIIFKVGQA